MKIYLSDQKGKLENHLNHLMDQPASQFEKRLLIEKISTITLQTKKSFTNLNLDFLFNYQIFPPSIMTFKTQWETERRKMKIGDTIVQQVFIPPFKIFSQKIIFGVRVNSIIDYPLRRGFSYVTLEGHVEKGESAFTIEQADDKVTFKIQTFSEPGNLISKLVAPIFSTPYQTFCTRKALQNVKHQIELQS